MDITDFIRKRQNISNRYQRKLDSLKRRDWDITHIKNGVDQVIANLQDGAKSLVIYGEPQSGKTEVMIALTCALLDMNVKTIFVVMNDNVELESQNFKRFKLGDINPTPMSATDFIDLDPKDKKLDTQRIIFCRKNKDNLEKLITECRFLKDRLIIDDEADYASPDNKINKAGKQSMINKLVGQLGQLDDGGRYIGVTATPGRLDLNNTFANKAEDWVFLTSHDKYIGRSYFFPLTDSDVKKSQFILEKLPETGDSPSFLEKAFLRFITKVAVLNLMEPNEDEQKNYSMLVHTDGTKSKHRKDKSDLESFLHNFTAQRVSKLERYYTFIDKYTQTLNAVFSHSLTSEQVCDFVHQNIGRHSVLVINSENDKDNVEASCNPQDMFTFAVGGNIVSRGLTFNNLLSFFFSRSVKGPLTQNTYVQRARMFGTRPYIKWFELCIPDSLYEEWAACFADHEMSIQSAIHGDLRHFSSTRTRSADSASIDKVNVVGSSGEIAAGEIFELNETLLQQLRFIKNKPISGFRKLKESGALPQNAIDDGVLLFVDGRSDNADDDSVIIDVSETFVYRNETNLNPKTLMRDRGGQIQAIIKGRAVYLEKAHVFLITADDKDRARILYRMGGGKRILKNLRKHLKAYSKQ